MNRFISNLRFRKELLVGLLLAFVAFVSLILIIHFYPVLHVDRSFTKELQEHSNTLLDNFMEAVSFFGYSKVAIAEVALATLCLYFFHYRREAIFCACTLAASGVNYLVKILVHRPRPGDGVIHVVQVLKNYSFPSGHVVHYTVFFGFLLYLMLNLKSIRRSVRALVSLLSASLIILIPFSRVYLGEHWLTDVAGGFFLGVLLLGTLIYLYSLRSNTNFS